MPTPRSKPRLNDLRHVQRRPGFADDYRGEEATEIPATAFELSQLRSDDPEKARRFAAEPPRAVFTSANEDVLKNALLVAHLELDRIRKSAQESASRGQPLPYEDQKLYLKLVDAVTKLTRETRAQDESTTKGVEALSREELLEKAALAVRVLSEDD